jgi:hypothetical protein
VSLFDKSLDEIETLLRDKLESLNQKYADIFLMDEAKLNTELVTTIYKSHSIRSEWLKAKMDATKLNRELQKLYSRLYSIAKEGEVVVTRPDGKDVNRAFSGESEIREWIYTNEKYQKLKLWTDFQKILVEYYEKLLDSIQMKQRILHNIQTYDRVY